MCVTLEQVRTLKAMTDRKGSMGARAQGPHGHFVSRNFPSRSRAARPKLVAVASRDSPHVMLGSLIRLAILLLGMINYESD